MANDDTLTEFEIFKDAIREENLERQIECTKHLVTLAKHLGAEVTRTELLPFIQENIDFHDEILLNMSEQLNMFIPLVGGYEHAQTLLDLLKKLCNTDETIVRDKTVETLKNIAENLDKKLIEELFLPMLEALTQEEDWFTTKCSAAALYPTIYPKVNEDKKIELRNSFRALIQDDSPIVRKAAIISLLDLIPSLDQDNLKDQFIPIFDSIAKDDTDSVRVYAVDVAIALARRLTDDEIEQYILPTIESWADDQSWRIRQRLALNIAEIQNVIPHGKTRGKILAIFQKLVKDNETDVRKVAAQNLIGYCKSLKRTYELQPHRENNFEAVFCESIMPQIRLLITDGNDDVRYLLSSIIISLSGVLREDSFKQLVLPVVVEILESDPSTPVQANILENMNHFPASVDITQSFYSLKSVLRSLIVNSSTHWRTRRSLLIVFMHIANITSQDYFSENLKVYYAALLGDPVFAVRRTAPVILPLLAKHYGIEWAIENIIPYFTMFRKDCRYLYRYVPLFGILEMINPTINLKDSQKCYVGSLKDLIQSTSGPDNRKCMKLFVKIKKITDKIRDKFNEQPYKDILSIQSFDDCKIENIMLYAEKTVEVLSLTYNYDVFAIKQKEVLNDTCTYLEGLLKLIYMEFLNVALGLFEDHIVNIQIRSINVINQIKAFIDDLSEELNDDFANSLTNEELDEIDQQVNLQLQSQTAFVNENTSIEHQLLSELGKDNFTEKTIPEIVIECPEIPTKTDNVDQGNTTNFTNNEQKQEQNKLPIEND